MTKYKLDLVESDSSIHADCLTIGENGMVDFRERFASVGKSGPVEQFKAFARMYIDEKNKKQVVGKRQKCEVCGAHADNVAMAMVRTTNGCLLWCTQCRDDINRKNPEVAKLRDELRQVMTYTDTSMAKKIERLESVCLVILVRLESTIFDTSLFDDVKQRLREALEV